MPNTTTLLSDERIQYEGVFSIAELYKHAYNWLTWRKFDVREGKYMEKAKATGKEIKIEWTAQKFLDEYSSFEIKIRWEFLNIRDAEKPPKMQQGEVNIFVTASIITDRQDFWAANAFYSFMRTFYDRYLYRSSYDRLKAELWKTGWDFFNER